MSLARGVDNAGSIATVCGCVAIAVLVFMIMPIYVGALADTYGFDKRQSGWLTSIELAGQVVAILLSLYWIRLLSWRLILFCSLVLLSLCNLLSVYVDGAYLLLSLLRFIAGFGVGCILAIGCAFLGDTAQADRNFGFLIAAEVLLQVIMFAVLPSYIMTYGVNTIYGTLALLALIALPMSALVPDQGRLHDRNLSARSGAARLPLLGLLATAIFFTGIMLVWSFIERLGISRNLTVDQIGGALAISGAVSLIGAFSAAVLGDRLGRTWPMLAGAFGILISYWVLLALHSFLGFVIAASLMAVFWNFWLPYQMGAVTAVDLDGHYAVLIPLAQSLGVAIGPAAAGLMLSGDDFLPLIVGSTILILACLALFLPLLKTLRPERPARSGAHPESTI